MNETPKPHPYSVDAVPGYATGGGNASVPEAVAQAKSPMPTGNPAVAPGAATYWHPGSPGPMPGQPQAAAWGAPPHKASGGVSRMYTRHLRSLQTVRDPSVADWDSTKRRQELRRANRWLYLGYMGEAGLAFLFMQNVLGRSSSASLEWLTPVLALAVVSAIIAVSGPIGKIAGAKSRTSMPLAALLLTLPLTMAVLIVAARSFHAQVTNGVASDANGGLGQSAGDHMGTTMVIVDTLLGLMFGVVYLITVMLAFYIGRKFYNPALLQMIDAKDVIMRDRKELMEDEAVLTRLIGERADTIHSIEDLERKFQTAVVETQAAFAAGSDYGRIRMAELLGDPKATGITKYRVKYFYTPVENLNFSRDEAKEHTLERAAAVERAAEMNPDPDPEELVLDDTVLNPDPNPEDLVTGDGTLNPDPDPELSALEKEDVPTEAETAEELAEFVQSAAPAEAAQDDTTSDEPHGVAATRTPPEPVSKDEPVTGPAIADHLKSAQTVPVTSAPTEPASATSPPAGHTADSDVATSPVPASTTRPAAAPEPPPTVPNVRPTPSPGASTAPPPAPGSRILAEHLTGKIPVVPQAQAAKPAESQDNAPEGDRLPEGDPKPQDRPSDNPPARS